MPVSLGQRVIIHGLNSKPELNGCEGIAESFDDVKGRYNVRLNTGAVMALRPDNLQVQMTLEEALQEDPVNQEKILSMIDSRSAACPLNNFGQFGLHLALKRGAGLAVTEALISAWPGAVSRQDRYGKLPLHYAVENRASEQEVVLLLGDGAHLKVQANNTFLALHSAAAGAAEEKVVRILLDSYPDAAKMSCTGGSYPLHLACELGGDPGSILAILSHHTDAVHITDDDGDLPIHAAAAGQASPQVIDALLSAFPESIRQTNKLGMLPLHKATKFPCGRLEKCSAPGQSVVPLVQAYPGAVRVRDKEGCIPLQYALVHNRSEGLHVDAASTGADKEAMPTHALVALVSKDMPIDLADGHPNTSHTFSWNHCVSTPGLRCARAVEIVLSTDPPGHGYGKHIAALAESPDEQGRPAIDAASREARQAIYAHLLFCGRYQLHFGPPEHRSATSVVLRARDQSSGLADYRAIFDKFDTNPKDGMLNPDELRGAAEELGLDAQLFLFRGSSAFKGDLASKTRLVSRDDFIATCKRLLGDGPREVVLKLMQDETQWRREKQSRSKQGLSARFIVQTLDAPPDDDVAAAVRAMNGDLRRLKDAYLPSITMGIRILVMDAADRNLFQVYQQERPDINAIRMILQQVAEALAHLHALGLMHGDVKMLNIVRFRLDGRLRLIDFDAGAIISDEEPSYAGAKFSSAILPPELLYELKGEADGAQLQAYWQQSDTDLQAKVAPLTLGGRSFAVRSFRSDANDEPIVEGLPYALEEASDKIDCWALGVLAYVLGAAEPLVSSTRDDDCASGGAMALLHDWGTKPKQVLARLNKVHDPALCDLVSKLLQRDAEKRLSAREALEHVFFRTGRDGGEVAPQQEVLDALKRIEAEQLEAKAEQKRQTAMLAAIQELSVENRSELAKTRTVLLKGIFEAAEVQTPTAFVVLRSKLPDPPSGMKARQPALKMEGDGSGFAVETGLINVSFTDEGVEMSSELLETYKSRFDEGMTWVTRLKAVGSMTLQGDVGGAFETIREGLGDLITAETMYLYLIDELTGEPVRGPGYPIEIKTPAEVVPKLLPVMQVGLRAMAVYNGAAGIGRAFGFPVPKVPKAWRQGAQQSVELLKQESSVAAFSVVHKQVKKTAEESQTVRGASLRELQKFFEANDKQGRFAGLQRIGDPENGTALWTTLSDPKQVKLALEERTRQREQELRAQGQQELLDNQVQQTPNPADSRGGLSRQLEELAQQQEKERCVTQAKLQQVLDEIQGMKAAGVCCVISYTPPPLSQKKSRHAEGAWWLTSVQPDRVGVTRQLRLGTTLKPTADGGFELDLSLPGAHKTSAVFGLSVTAVPAPTCALLEAWVQHTGLDAAATPCVFKHVGADRSTPLAPSRWTETVQAAFKRHSGVALSPKDPRSSYVTFLRSLEHDNAVLRAAALAMRHSERQASGPAYDKGRAGRLGAAAVAQAQRHATGF